tara:strand:+ start:678 stop:1097 length:420 start_codon:yes stop_codon:yes gene_type:complete
MLSIFKKKLFGDTSGTSEDIPPHVSAVICLMIEIARLDGKIDENEIEEIKSFYSDLYPDGNFSEVFNDLKDWTSHKESFNPFINIINSNCTKKMKIEILENIWSVILSDDNIDPYEESLFMQIGDLLIISKHQLEKIKQ